MWKQIEIAEETYFLKCEVADSVTFMLCNLLHQQLKGWSENNDMAMVLQRVKTLNKRIQFDAQTIEQTLTMAQPVEAQLEAGEAPDEQKLRLKYRVGTHPFHFRLHLQAQNNQQFYDAITLPLLLTLHGMSQQLDELREVIAKKDIELKQYKDEGAILRRSTVATQPFDSALFAEKHLKTNEYCESFQPIAALLKQQHLAKAQLTELPKCSNSTKAQATAANIVEKDKKKNSPRARKRRALELQQRHIEMKIKAARKQKIEYESSQSQSLSQSLSNSPPPLDAISQELEDIKRALRELDRKRLADMPEQEQNSRFL